MKMIETWSYVGDKCIFCVKGGYTKSYILFGIQGSSTGVQCHSGYLREEKSTRFVGENHLKLGTMTEVLHEIYILFEAKERFPKMSQMTADTYVQAIESYPCYITNVNHQVFTYFLRNEAENIHI